MRKSQTIEFSLFYIKLNLEWQTRENCIFYILGEVNYFEFLKCFLSSNINSLLLNIHLSTEKEVKNSYSLYIDQNCSISKMNRKKKPGSNCF